MDTFTILIVVIVSMVYTGQNNQIMLFQCVYFKNVSYTLKNLLKQDPLGITAVWVQRVCSSHVIPISLLPVPSRPGVQAHLLISESSLTCQSAWQGAREGTALAMRPGAVEKAEFRAGAHLSRRGCPLRTVCAGAKLLH